MSLMSTDDKFVVSIPFKHLPAIYRLFGVSLTCWELIPATCISMSLHLDTIGPSLSLFLTSLASTPSDWMGWLGPLAEQCFFPANFILLWVANGSKEEFIDLGRRNWTSQWSRLNVPNTDEIRGCSFAADTTRTTRKKKLVFTQPETQPQTKNS